MNNEKNFNNKKTENEYYAESAELARMIFASLGTPLNETSHTMPINSAECAVLKKKAIHNNAYRTASTYYLKIRTQSEAGRGGNPNLQHGASIKLSAGSDDLAKLAIPSVPFSLSKSARRDIDNLRDPKYRDKHRITDLAAKTMIRFAYDNQEYLLLLWNIHDATIHEDEGRIGDFIREELTRKLYENEYYRRGRGDVEKTSDRLDADLASLCNELSKKFNSPVNLKLEEIVSDE